MNYKDITDDLMTLLSISKEIDLQIVIKQNSDIMLNRILSLQKKSRLIRQFNKKKNITQQRKSIVHDEYHSTGKYDYKVKFNKDSEEMPCIYCIYIISKQ